MAGLYRSRHIGPTVTADVTRRGFLAGLLGTAVIAALPALPDAEATPPIPASPYDVKPPDGVTYNWVRTSLLGEPDYENLDERIRNGWKFVTPDSHPDMANTTVDIAIERQGLILMYCPTVEVEARRAAEQAAVDAAQPQWWRDAQAAKARRRQNRRD